MQNFTIPLVMEYAYFHLPNKATASLVNEYILKVYDRLYNYFQKDLEEKVNINNKLIETVKSRIIITKYSDSTFWKYVENIGKNTNNFVYELVKKLKTDIVPKYDINRSIVQYNIGFANNSMENFIRTNFPVTYKTIDLSSKSEEEETGKFERLEIASARFNEDLNVMNKINISKTIQLVQKEFNIKISKNEFAFYKQNLKINKLQTNLLSLFYAKYLGSCNVIYNCSLNQYLMLLLLMKKILKNKECEYIPEILTGHIDVIKEKKVVSKKYMTKIVEDERYKKILEFNYNNSINLIIKQSKREK